MLLIVERDFVLNVPEHPSFQRAILVIHIKLEKVYK